MSEEKRELLTSIVEHSRSFDDKDEIYLEGWLDGKLYEASKKKGETTECVEQD